MHITAQSPGQRLLRITHRAREISIMPTRCKPMTCTLSAPAAAVDLKQPQSTAGECESGSDRASGDGIEGSRRSSPRKAVASEICVRRTGGFNFQAGLTDVSLGGCRVELIEPCEIGDHVIARFPALEPLGARVCWSAGVTAGVAFQAPVHPAVFDALLIRLRAIAA